MDTSVKVRLLLVVLFISLFFMALTVKTSYSAANLLESSALTLQKNLNENETIVEEFLNNPVNFASLKNIGQDEKEALKLIKEFSTTKKIYFFTYKNNKLDFWSSIRIVPDNSSAYKNGTSFIRKKNGYYVAIKKTQGDFSVLFFIPVKTAYRYQNQYLIDHFSPQLLNDDYITFASAQDKQAFKINSLHNGPLFAVKLKTVRPASGYFASAEGILWMLSITVLFVLLYNICSYIADKGYPKTAVLLAFLCVVLGLGINFFLHVLQSLPVGSQVSVVQFEKSYHSPYSIGNIALLILFLSWFAVFVFNHRHLLARPIISKVKSYVVLVLMVLLLVVLSIVLSNLFYGLVINSQIQFDIDNLLNLTAYNFLGTVMLCLAYLVFYLFSETFIGICAKLNIPDRSKLAVFIGIILLATAWHSWHYQYFTWYYLLWAVVVAWRAYNVFYENGDMPAIAFILVLAVSSVVATNQLSRIQGQQERAQRKTMVHELINTVDSNAEYIFRNIENRIAGDENLSRYVTSSNHNEVYLKNQLRKMYFDDYLAKYNFKMYAYDSQNHNISGQQDYELSVFKSQVFFGSLKVDSTNYFYRAADAFGERRYFALIPIKVNHEVLGTLVVDLKSKTLESRPAFPLLLVDEKLKQQNDYKKYSYAFYNDNKLVSQNGKFEYNLHNTQFKGRLKNYATVETTSPGYNRYNHLIYRPTERKLIVVSLEDTSWSDRLSVFIFFFVIFLVFALLVVSLYWFFGKLQGLNFNHLWWSLNVAANNLLYKTRIQISMVASVVFTLLIIGLVTMITFTKQYQKQQDDINHEKIKRIANDYESQMMDSNSKDREGQELRFNAFAETYSADMMLYDTSGVPVFYTRPQLYNYGLMGRRMNAVAYINMKRLQKSEFLNDEEIGRFKFKAAYMPIHNTEGNVVNFLQLPYFDNDIEYKNRIGYFANSMINAYAFVLVAIGLFAVFIAKRITNPLTLIQQGLSNTMYGRKTEPINWKRNDEIGSLIKEYNKMIASLELSANKLAKSERESAWREMAKQVAHEIKNPLTPLKLGLQLLSKAFKDKDPKFDMKFQRFSLSFIEQIESLSRIATEFSDFARLPDAKPEVVNVFDIISRAVNVFNQSNNLRIDYTPSPELFLIRADKDQLLRCFNNLLKNSIEAMPPDQPGVISITYQTSTKHHILIDVKDNGGGIPEKIRDNIFQPNFTTKSSGTGLGLAFIKSAIENAGGKIWFETEIGSGTTFHLFFPCASMSNV